MDRIRRWFVDHQDGENADFLVPPPGCTYSVIPPISRSQGILYTSKPHEVLFLCSQVDALPFGVIGRWGLPHETELDWLKSMTEDRPLCFVGDADPCDLLIFAWLKQHMEISFRGINDRLLDTCGVSLSDPITIPQSAVELTSMQLVIESLPELEDLLGCNCLELVKSGEKIECEVLSSFAKAEPDVVLRSMMQ